MSVDDIHSLSKFSSTDTGCTDDPFGLFLRNGKVQLMVQNEITTAGTGCMPAEMSPEFTMNEMTLFTCEHCPYRTKYKWEFKKHLNRHVGSTKPCKDCNMPFKSLSHLNRHRKAVHGDVLSKIKRTPHRCDMCPYVSVYNTDMRRHKNRHQAEGGYHCKHCNHPFTKIYKMLNHVKKVHVVLDGNGDRKTSSEKTTNDQSLTEGIKKAKETLLRRNEVITNVNNSVNQNKRDMEELQQLNESRKRTTHDSDKMESPGTERSCKRLINILNCAFCGHVARSYADLKEHLDVHDDEFVDPEKNKDLFVGPKDYPAEQLFVQRSLDNFDQREKLVDIDNTNNEIADLDTNINSAGKDIYFATRCNDLQEQLNVTVPSGEQEDSFAKISDVEQDYKDAMDIYGECVSKITKNFEDEFIVRPFACAKCCFTTGNIDRLKIHVEAHLYEKARQAYSVAHRGYEEEHDGTSGYVLNEVSGSHNKNISHRNFPNSWNREMKFVNDEIRAFDNPDHEVENNVSNIENDDNVIEDTDEGFCDKDSECKQNRCTEPDKKVEIQNMNYIGRLSRGEFKKTKQLYKMINANETHGGYKETHGGYKETHGGYKETHGGYECSVCENNYYFQNINLLKEHFKQTHRDLRERICTTCKHCSKPFP